MDGHIRGVDLLKVTRGKTLEMMFWFLVSRYPASLEPKITDLSM